jgi:hypothetical protein
VAALRVGEIAADTLLLCQAPGDWSDAIGVIDRITASVGVIRNNGAQNRRRPPHTCGTGAEQMPSRPRRSTWVDCHPSTGAKGYRLHAAPWVIAALWGPPLGPGLYGAAAPASSEWAPQFSRALVSSQRFDAVFSMRPRISLNSLRTNVPHTQMRWLLV